MMLQSNMYAPPQLVKKHMDESAMDEMYTVSYFT
jgi:hypothetical protein